MFLLTIVHNPGDYMQEIGADYMKLKISEWEILRAGMTQNGYREVIYASIQKGTVSYIWKKKKK